ncbi:reverse transcriptase domain-containing protein [Tanacetum coccineum]
MLKFLVLGGILTLRSIKIIPLECTMVSGLEVQPSAIIQAAEERIKVAIHLKYLKQTIAICSTLTEEGRKALCGLLMRYHQIKMAKEDEEKTAFITSQGIFCYSKMPFGLKNAGATYQRLVDKSFQKQIGRNLEVFLAKSAERSLPFFKTLKKCTKKSDFQWTTEAKSAFKQMKKLIAELPTLTAPMEKEELIVYLTPAIEAVSTVLMTEREMQQMPIYFISRALQDSKTGSEVDAENTGSVVDGKVNEDTDGDGIGKHNTTRNNIVLPAGTTFVLPVLTILLSLPVGTTLPAGTVYSTIMLVILNTTEFLLLVILNTARYALMINPTIHISCIEQFWSTVKAKTINREAQLHAVVDGKKIIITESSVRRDLQLADEESIDCLPNSTIFEQLALMGPKTTAWNEFSSTMASAIIYLATN